MKNPPLKCACVCVSAFVNIIRKMNEFMMIHMTITKNIHIYIITRKISLDFHIFLFHFFIAMTFHIFFSTLKFMHSNNTHTHTHANVYIKYILNFHAP